MYLFGAIFTSGFFAIDAFINNAEHIDEILGVIEEKEEIVGIILFSCLNDIMNTVLLLYLMRKAYISKTSVYGIINALFIVGEGVAK